MRPRYVLDPPQLVAVDPQRGQREIPASRMFEIRDALAAFSAKAPGEELFDLSQGDGGASLEGVPHRLLDRALELLKQQGTGYTPPLGSDAFRRVTAERYWQLDAASGWGPQNVVATQGGRDALLKAYDAALLLEGNRRGDVVVVSAVPWISYKWGAYAMGANVMLAAGDPADAWALSAEAITACIAEAARSARRVALLVITSPDNPTGRTTPVEQQAALAAQALDRGVGFVLFDWIYNQVTASEPQDVKRLLAALSPQQRRRCIVLDGLTKALGASNIRSAHLLADQDVVEVVKARASHGAIPCFYSQALAIAAYEEGRSAYAAVVEPTNASREVLRAWLGGSGLPHILGEGYYAFINVEASLRRAGFADSAALSAYSASEHGLALVPGAHFSAAGSDWLRLSYALPPELTRRALQRFDHVLAALSG